MSRPPSLAAPPFVGRERELRALDAAFRLASGGGRMRIVLLLGDAGVGKTRTTQEFLRRTGLATDRILWGRCPEQAGAPTYWPWATVLRQWAESCDDDALRAALGDGVDAVAAIVPSVAERLGRPPAAAVDPDRARFHLFDAVAALFRRLAAETPLVVVLDDLHWADDSSLQLLAFLGAEIRSERLFVLGTYREREVRASRALTALGRVAQRVPLGGLDRAAVEAFVAGSMGQPPAPAVVDRLVQVTDGNPFFLDEVLRGLPAADGAAFDTAVGNLPESVRDAVRRRLAPLGDDERALLTLAAVAGRDFDLSVLQAAAALSADQALAQLAAPTALGLIAEHGVVGRFRFAHALVRETLYADLLPAARIGLHARVGTALEQVHGDAGDAPLAELAAHFAQAAPVGEAARAIDYATRAGARAVELAAYDDGVVHYERALASFAFLAPDEPRRLEVRLALGEAAHLAAQSGKALAAFAQAAQNAAALGDGRRFVRAALGYERARGIFGGVDPRAVELLERALDVIGESDRPPRAVLLAMLVEALYFGPDHARRDALADEAVAVAARTGSRNAVLVAAMAHQLTQLGLGDPVERVARADQTLAAGAALGARGAMHRSRMCRIHALLELGDVTAAEIEIETLVRQADEARVPYYQWQAAIHRAGLALLRGQWVQGARMAAEAMPLRRDANDGAVRNVFCLQMFLCRGDAGDPGGLEATMRSLAAEFPGIVAWQALLALLLIELGRPAEARALIDARASENFSDLPRDALYAGTVATFGMVAALLDDRAHAARLYPLLLPYEARNLVIAPFSPGSFGSAARYLGLLAHTLGRLDDAVAHFERALGANQRMGALPLAAHTQHELARTLLERGGPGDTARAATLLAEARTTAIRFSMQHLLARMEGLETPAPPIPTATVGGGSDRRFTASLRRDGDHWTVTHGTDGFAVKHSKGVTVLATLLAHPGQDFHVLDLVRDDGASGPPTVTPSGDGVLLDPGARDAYKRRLEDLQDELEEAERFNDPGRAARAREEIAFLAGELSQGVGLTGRDRKAAAAAERARQNVTRTIGSVLKKLAAGSPGLGVHLAATIRTGVFCSYQPDPRLPVRWTF